MYKNNKSYEKVNCDLCGSWDVIEVPYCRQYTNNQPIHICKICGLVYFRYRRKSDLLAKFWEKEIYEKGVYTSHNPTFISRHIYALEFIKRYIGIKKRNIIDIGAGEGQFLNLVRKEGGNIFGIESASRNSKILSNLNIPHFNGTVEDYVKNVMTKSNANIKSDLVTILWTLQNSQSCVDMLNAAYGMLNKGGYLFIQMGSRINVPFKKPLGSYLSTLPQDNQPYHFSINTLQGILAKCNFEIIMTNKYWDEDLLCVLAKKNTSKKTIKWEKDNYQEIRNFFIRWHKESLLMKQCLKILPLNYEKFIAHTF